MKVGIAGYGRFGRALGWLLEEASIPHRAFDPTSAIADGVRASSLAELAAASELIVVAVPIPAIRDVLNQLRPHLAPAVHTVIDVGSVKLGPANALDEILGGEVPWVATHPLFGPTSLALGERPLHVVVCPSPRHPEAERRVVRFYEKLGCHVVEQDAEAHDRAMADTHALTFFVAKGMLDAGAGEGAAFTPPSFQAIARTIETVRSDAGHLYAALHRENPFSSDSRRRLLDALISADRDLSRPAEGATTASRLSIPDLGDHAPELREARVLIDELDHELIALLGRRAHLSRRAGQAKAELGKAVYDPGRESRMLEARREWGAELGVDASSIDDIFDAVLRFSRRVQSK